MSDIFKKIRSIEAKDEAVTRALGLTPFGDGDETLGDTNTSQPSRKPLKLSVPDDDSVLDLDELSLDAPDEAHVETAELGSGHSGGLDDAGQSSTRLGLTPIMPIGKPRSQLHPMTQSVPIPKPAAEPLPRFLDTAPEDLLDPKVLKKQPKASSANPIAEIKFIEHPKGEGPYGQAVETSGARPLKRFITVMGILAAILWMVCVGLLASDMFGRAAAWNAMSVLQKLGFAIMALFPLALIGLCTAAFRHLNSLGNDADKLKVTAEALMRPDDTVISRSTIMAKSIQAQVDEVNLKVSSALNRMELLDDMVKSQSSSLAKSTLAIDTTAKDVEHRMNTQREGLESVADLFDGRMTTLSEMLERHSTQLATSGQMADQRVQEARLSVEGAAEKITAASETVRQNAVIAARTLSGSHDEITKLGDEVQMQSVRLDGVYRQHLKELKVMLTDLSEEQDGLAITMEERLSKMREMSLSAKVGAQNLTDASIKGRETVEALNEAASLTDTAVRARFSEMEDMVKYSTARAESISETATRQVQNSLSSTRKEISRIEADMMDLMYKLKRAETSKAVAPLSPNSALRGLQSPTTASPPPHDSEDDKLSSMEYRDVFSEKDAPPPVKNPSETSIFSLRRPVEDYSSPSPAANEGLDFHPPADEDLPKLLRRPIGDEATERNKWSLRGMFGSADSTDTPPRRNVNEDEIIEGLTKLGLTPAAIVDDGCIIEAANLRTAKSVVAMSEAVAKRLNEPVRHLFLAIETDSDLKSNISEFTAQFDDSLAQVGNDRESIRKKLESDAGRAYLLCAAALNA